MILKNSVDPGNKARNRKEREKAVQKFAAKTIPAAQIIKDTLEEKEQEVKNP